MIRTKGEPGTGNVVEAVRHIRQVNDEIRWVSNLPEDELMTAAKEMQVPMSWFGKRLDSRKYRW
jgi:pyridoxal 5'-phosphate synthase pdxS subunit